MPEQNKANSLRINIFEKLRDINLDAPCPDDLMQSNFRGQRYISVSVVREISRRLNRRIKEMFTTCNEINQQVMYQTRVVIVINGDEYVGEAFDCVSITKFHTTCFPNVARMQALAIKNALKRKYAFFETDLLTVEQAEERGIGQGVEPVTKVASTQEVYDGLLQQIQGATTQTALSEISGAITKAATLGHIDSTAKAKLIKEYNDKYAKL